MLQLDFPETETASWEKLPDENDLWFSRFDKYARPQGREYSLRTAYMLWRLDQPESHDLEAYVLWKNAEVQYEWSKRAGEWDIFNTSFLKYQWNKRKMDLLERDWSNGGSLREMGEKFLKILPTLIEESRVEVDGETIVVKKVNLRPGELSQLLKIGSELQRLAVNEPTSINSEIGSEKTVRLYLPQTTSEDAFNGTMGMSAPTETPKPVEKTESSEPAPVEASSVLPDVSEEKE